MLYSYLASRTKLLFPTLLSIPSVTTYTRRQRTLNYVAMYFSAYPLILISVTPLLNLPGSGKKRDPSPPPQFRALYTGTLASHWHSHTRIYVCM